MDVFHTLRSFDPQGLTPDQLKHAVDILGAATLRAKATALLQPAFAAEWPGFQGFGRIAMQRFESVLHYVYVHADGSIAAEMTETLRELDTISFIVCGLCLSKKVLTRLDKGLFEEVIKQARGSSHRLVNTIMASSEIAEVVRKSNAEIFKKYLDQLLQLRIGAQPPEASLSLAGLPSWCYSVPSRRTIKFNRLVASAIGGAVSTYIPIRPELADCLIRVVINFNEALLKTLFGIEHQEHNAEHLHLHAAVKDQIAVVFGDDVLEAAQASQQWSNDADKRMTSCVNADVYAGHSIIINIIIGRKECVNFVNIAYGL